MLDEGCVAPAEADDPLPPKEVLVSIFLMFLPRFSACTSLPSPRMTPSALPATAVAPPVGEESVRKKGKKGGERVSVVREREQTGRGRGENVVRRARKRENQKKRGGKASSEVGIVISEACAVYHRGAMKLNLCLSLARDVACL